MIKKANPGAVVGIIIGIIIIIFAVVMIGNIDSRISTDRLSSSDLSRSSQIQFKYSFGADFYTEMFGVTYNTLQQLEDMSSDNTANIAAASNAIVSSMRNGMSQTIKQLGSLLAYVIMAIGLATAGLSCSKLFVWVPGEKAVKDLRDPEFNFRPAPNDGTGTNWAEPEEQPEETPGETEPDNGSEEIPEENESVAEPKDLPPEDGLAE